MSHSILPSHAWSAFGLLVAAMGVPLRAQPTAAIGADTRSVFPNSVSQGALVIGKVPLGSYVKYAGRTLRVSDDGSVV